MFGNSAASCGPTGAGGTGGSIKGSDGLAYERLGGVHATISRG